MNINKKTKKQLDKLVMEWQNRTIGWEWDNIPALIQTRTYEQVIKDINNEFGTNYISNADEIYNKQLNVKLKDKPLEKIT